MGARLGAFAVCAFLSAFAWAGGQAARGGDFPVTKVAPSGPPSREGAAKGECPNLDSSLRAVAKAPDPLASARAAGLPVRDGMVQVLIVLSGTDASVLSEFGAKVGKRLGAEIQAYVSPAALCGLAGDSRVLAVRAPGQALIP